MKQTLLTNKSTGTFWCRLTLTVLLLFAAIGVLPWSTLHAQTFTGTVVSAADNEPLIGATIGVQGRNANAVTDLDGRFSIDAREGETLLVSYIGFVQQKVRVKGQTITITLQEESHSLNDVVVIGYGVQKKKLVTGATVQVKGEDLAKRNTGNALQAMQGQTPGVNIIAESGQPGAGMKVIVRGQGSNTGAGPLYVIDGIPGLDITAVNPSDIESIDVLKDAASAAIYGAQAANGVVIVTTRGGKEGRAQVTFDGYRGWQTVPKKTKMLNASEYMMLMDEQNKNSGGTAYDWGNTASIHNTQGGIYDTNWMDEMFQSSAPVQNYTLGVNGGSKGSTYAVSLGYYSQEGIVGGKQASNYERYNLRSNLEQKLFNDVLTIGENLSFSYVKSTSGITGNMYNNKLRGAYSTSPLQPVYLQPDGREDLNNGYSYSIATDWNQYDGNPVANLYRNRSASDAQNWVATVYAELQPLKNLRIKTLLGFNNNSSSYRAYNPMYVSTVNDQNTNGSTVSQSMFKGWTLTWTNTAMYDWKMGLNQFNTMLGMEVERTQGESVSGGNTLLPVYDGWATAYLSNDRNGHTGSIYGYPTEDYRRISYFGRVGWNYDDKYMANLTLRADGSSRFAKGHRWGWFPSVSAGWVITRESFMEQTSSWLDFLKIRASWGQVGNNNIGAFLYAATVTLDGAGYNFGTGKGSVLNTNGALSNRLGNDHLKWETSEQTDLGIDARFLRSRLGFNFDWYYKTTKDWIVQAPILATAGADSPFINGGNVTNQGVEMGLTWDDNMGRSLRYNVGVNFAYNRNEVNEIPTTGGIIHGYANGSTNANVMFNNQPEFFRCQNGHAMGFFWGYRTAGIFQNQQEIDAWKAAGKGVLPNTEPGDVRFVDVDEDGTIDDGDKVDLGNGIPKFNFGLNLGLTYKQFDFAATLSGAADFKVANGGYRNWGNSVKGNYTTEYLGRWHGEGTSNTLPRLTNDDRNWTNFSDLYLQDGSYLRIANLIVGYDFSKLIRFKLVSQARLYFQVQNLYTFTGYNGMDPEVGFGEHAWMSGIDTGSYPHARTFIVGVNVKF
ncbi:SusC/RagA family TonB-linked outer membrane protein [[Hallella] seregens]|uniref:SusC/RagA family TonB-linked outer membrane protein n=1 Tax=Hallella seregens ATCC 51272 TaxID=1336250 RepID=A0ABV5ZKM9_9BACT|nr:TonB-dependent receptor [Hallella seregens]